MSLDELLATAERLVTDGITPACQIAVARDGQLLEFATFGAATNESRFSVFSATKPVVASLLWLLIGDGLVDPAARVGAYVPEFADKPVSVEQVMLHTSGFPNAVLPRVATREERRAAFARWTLEWEPGSRFEYHATSAHWVLADIVERVTGNDFRDELHDRVMAPLGLPRLLGTSPEPVVDCVRIGTTPPDHDYVVLQNDPAVRAAGVPGGGGLATAATMALWYQAVLQNRLWDDAVWHDALTNVRCHLPDPLMGVSANRTLGLVLAGDDGLHQLRYAAFGRTNSPAAFGHAGAYLQVAWADPATGISFAFCKNGCNEDMIGDAGRVLPLCDLAAQL